MSEDRSEAVHRLLSERGLTVAVAESLTGGLLSAALTRTPGSSSTFRGGLVVYATDLKAHLAGVAQALLDSQGPVSREVAAALAAGVRERLSADLGLAVTGVAGPEPVGKHPAGTVFLAVTGAGTDEVSRADLTGSRAEIRAGTVTAALDLLVSAVTSAGEREFLPPRQVLRPEQTPTSQTMVDDPTR